MRSFGIEISILFQDAALSLLVNSTDEHPLKQFIKPANKMVQSFEFYDIENLYVLKKDADHPLVLQSEHPLKAIEFNAAFLMQFDHMITW